MGNSPSILLETVKNRDVQQFNNIAPKISQIGLDINYVDEEGKTALHWASSLGELDMVSALIDAGADAEKQDVQGCPPLISAVFMGQTKAAELLLDKAKVSIDKANKDGMTALHWAIVEKRYDCVELLIRKGCSLEAKNNKGQTPSEIVSRLKPKQRTKMEQFIFECIEKFRPNTKIPPPSADIPKPSTPEKPDTNAKTRRLAVLCKVWGLVKFMHPFLSYKNIDWDGALLRAIPKLNNANTTADYQNVVNDLLSALEDPNTYCYAPDNTPKKAPQVDDAEQPLVKFTEDGVGVLVVTHHEKFIDYQHKMIPLINSFKEVSSPKSKAIVFDIRLRKGSNINASSYPFKFMFFEAFRSTLLEKELSLPAYRQRMMTGFPQFRNFGNIFHSGVSVTEADKVEPNTTGPLPKRNIVFVINKGTPDTLVDLATALQVAGLAKVVLEKQANEPNLELGISTFQVNIGENLLVNIRKNERVNGDGSIGLIPDLVLTLDTDAKTDTILEMAISIAKEATKVKAVTRVSASPYISKTIDKEYSENSYPSAELRMLALFRFWNIVNYFFPYKSLMDKSWDEILMEFIPKVENAKNDVEYHLTIAELVANCRDSHSSTTSTILGNFVGNYQPPIEVKFIEGKTVITYLFDTTLQAQGLAIGDEVIGFEKDDMEERKKKLSKILPASTKQALQLKIHQKLLSGEKDSEISLRVKSSNDGQTRVIRLRRNMLPLTRAPIKPTFGVLPEGVGFIDTVNLAHGDFEKAFDAIKNTPALILDIRGYPKGTIYQLAPRLTDKKVTVAITQTPMFLPSMLYSELESSFIEEKHKLQPSSAQKYKGKIIALINEETISHAEHSCLYLSACTDVTFIGTPTNGANGNVTNCALPGGILIGFTGLGTLHANNSQLQRKGIQPNILVEPTIEGLRKNVDEIMMKAIEVATKRP